MDRDWNAAITFSDWDCNLSAQEAVEALLFRAGSSHVLHSVALIGVDTGSDASDRCQRIVERHHIEGQWNED